MTTENGLKKLIEEGWKDTGFQFAEMMILAKDNSRILFDLTEGCVHLKYESKAKIDYKDEETKQRTLEALRLGRLKGLEQRKKNADEKKAFLNELIKFDIFKNIEQKYKDLLKETKINLKNIEKMDEYNNYNHNNNNDKTFESEYPSFDDSGCAKTYLCSLLVCFTCCLFQLKSV